MTVTAFPDIDVERITTRAKRVGFAKTVLRLIAFVLIGLGWIAAKAFSYTWFAMVWVALAFAEGWQAGRVDVLRAQASRGG